MKKALKRSLLLLSTIAGVFSLTSCDLFTKNGNNTNLSEQKSDKTILGLGDVTAPKTIEKNGKLSLSDVQVVVKYTDGTSETVTPSAISLVTTKVGPVTGTVFYFGFSKTFTIEVVETAVPVYVDNPFVGIQESQNKVDNGVRYLRLNFTNVFSSDSQISDIQTLAAGNLITLGDKKLSEISGATLTAPKGAKYLLFTFPATYNILTDSLFKIEDGCIIGNSKLSGLKLVFNGTKFEIYVGLSVQANPQFEIVKDNGYSLKIKNIITVNDDVDISKISYVSGTYFIRKDSYLSSGLPSYEDYIQNNLETSKTFSNVINQNGVLKESNNYSYYTSLKLTSSDYKVEFIPVSYLKVNNKIIYGVTSYSASLIDIASEHQDLYPDLFPENCTFTLTTSKSAEIVKVNSSYSLKFNSALTMSEGYKLDYYTYTSGYYLINKTAYENSTYLTIKDYISNVTSSSSTYLTKTAKVNEINNTYNIVASFDISKENYNTMYIPVAYFKVFDRIYLGQDGTYSCSLFNEAKSSLINYPELFLDHYSIDVETNSASNIEMKYESYYLKNETSITVSDDGNLNDSNYEYGTYLINKDHFVQSGSSSFAQYISTYSSSSNSNISTYYKQVGLNSLNKNEGSYKFSSSILINKVNYKTDFIPVGYLRISGVTMYGVKDDDYKFNSLYSVAMKNPDNYQDICADYFTASINSTDVTYELKNASSTSDIISLTYSKNGYYKVTANRKVNEFYLNGNKIANFTMIAGQTKYISVSNGQYKMQDNEHDLYLGFAEPNKEVFKDYNSNVYLNTYSNNAVVFSEMNGKIARIWVSVPALYWGPGKGHPRFTSSGYIDFTNQEAITLLQNTISAYRAAGIKEIILSLGGMYYSNDDYMFFHDTGSGIEYLCEHDVYNVLVKSGYSSGSQEYLDLANQYPSRSVFPTINYDVFLENNRKMIKHFGDLFDCDYIETLNEINLNPTNFDVEANMTTYGTALNSSGNAITCIPMADQRIIRDRVAEKTADYCKTMSNGIASSARKNIRIMTPAIACLEDTPGVPVPKTNKTKWYQLPTVRSSYDYLNKMYDYIITTKGERVQDYFQVVNFHPYIYNAYETGFNETYMFWSKDENCGLTPEERQAQGNGSKTEANYNTDVAEDWTEYMDYMRIPSTSHGDNYIPMIATEFGFTDYYGVNTAGTTFSNARFIPDTIKSVFAKAKTLNYFSGLCWFRLYSFDKTLANGVVTDGGESNFGFITKEKTLKNWGKQLYTEYTGKTDYSTLFTTLSSLVDDYTVYDEIAK